MDDDDEAPNFETGGPLARIASFFVPESSQILGASEPTANDEETAQALAVMRLFLRLKGTQARARCVSFIIQELLRDSPSIDPAPDD